MIHMVQPMIAPAIQPTNPPIANFAVHVTTSYIGGSDEATLVTVVHIEPAGDTSYAAVYRVTGTGDSQLIGQSPPTIGKVDSASAEMIGAGTVRLWVSAAAAPHDPGSSSSIGYMDFPIYSIPK
jgi:hypothetical protein